MWPCVPLSKVVEIQSGAGFPKKYQGLSRGDYPFFKVGDMNLPGNEVWLTTANNYISEDVRKKLRAKAFPGGSIVFPKIGGAISTNKKRLVSEPCCADNNVMGLIPKHGVLSSEFLYYWMLSIDLYEFSNKAALPSIRKSTIAEWPFLLPPLDEQKRIVAILDQAFEGIDKAIANTEQNLKNARELFDSCLHAAFTQNKEGWIERKLSDLCEKITDGTHQTPKYFEDGYIFLSSKNVTTGVIDWDNIKFVDEAQHTEMQRRLSPRRGDILLAKNGTTGVAALVDRDVDFNIYVSLAHIRSLGEIHSELLLKYINSPLAKKQFNRRLKGTGVPNLHLKEIREVLVRFPECKTRQAELILRLDALQQQISELTRAHERKVCALNELKQSLLQKAFSGKLTTENAQEAAKVA